MTSLELIERIETLLANIETANYLSDFQSGLIKLPSDSLCHNRAKPFPD